MEEIKMKTYEILIDSRLTNKYINGRINGIIYVLTGMPKKQYRWEVDERDTTMWFDATEEQAKAVADCLNNLYPNIYMGMREVE
jgi:hypothetical protein